MTPLASLYHLILICIERYIAIIYPLKYETKFTDRTLKWSIAAAWAIGILAGMTFSFWVINADLRKCDLIPVPYHLLDFVAGYVPVCISMLVVYGKILVIWWHQRKRVRPIDVSPAPAGGASGQATAVKRLPATQSNEAANTGQAAKDKSLASTGPPTEPTAATSADVAAEQQRQQIKSRRREFKAVYLTAAIVGMFVILWIPHNLGRVLGAAGYNPVIVSYIGVAGGGIGTFNFAFSWVIYAAVSKSYRRAYRKVLSRSGGCCCCCCTNIALQADNSLVV